MDVFEKIKKARDGVGQAAFELDHPQTIKVNLIPDTTVSRGHFRPLKGKAGEYYAHPITIKAMKKDIFATDENMLDFADIIICESCHQEVDRQFWFFCPYCETSFHADYSK